MTGSENIFYQLHVAALAITPGLPLLLVIGCCLPPLRQTVSKILPLAAVPALLAGFLVPIDMVASVPWFFMGGRMGLDETSRVFLCSSAVVWLLAGIDLSRKMAEARGRYVLFGCFLAAMAGNFGLILAQELLGFYLFFALMSFSAYGLVVFHKSKMSLRAGRIYIIMIMISEVALFAALALLAKSSGSLAIADLKGAACSPAVMAALYIGLGVKTGALPLHVWMAPAYQATPAPAAAALAGATVNAGILGWLKLLFPLEHIAPAWALFFMAIGVTAVFFGVIRGFRQRSPGAVLACSSISQMGLMTAIVGIGLFIQELREQATFVLSLFAVHHAFAKSSLFLGYSALIRRGGQLSTIHFAALLLPALSLAGLPLTSGATIKNGLKDLIVAIGAPWNDVGNYLLAGSSVATTLLIFHFIKVLFRTVSQASGTEPVQHPAWYGSVFMTAVALWIWPQSRGLAFAALTTAKLWHSLWPIILGGSLVFLWNRITITKQLRPWSFSCSMGKVLNRFSGQEKQRVLRHSLYLLLESDLWILHHVSRAWRHTGVGRRLGKIEKRFERWGMAGLFYLALSITILFLL